MPQQSPSQVRIIDPILSTHAQGYKHLEHVGHNLFPRVNVTQSGGQVIEFGKESFKLLNMRRAPGADRKSIQFGYLGRPYALVQDALDGKVPRENLRDASVVPGIDLGRRAVNNVMSLMSLALEFEQATLATTFGNYDANHRLAAANAWSNPANDPKTNIDAGREAIRSSVGIYPNTLLLSASAFNAAANNPFTVDRFKYTSSASVTAEMLAALWNIQHVVVGRAIAFNDAGASIDIWGNNAVLAYTAMSGNVNIEEPSYGYTYTMDGHPLVEESWFNKSNGSWMYPVTYERIPVSSGITAGFLIQNPA